MCQASGAWLPDHFGHHSIHYGPALITLSSNPPHLTSPHLTPHPLTSQAREAAELDLARRDRIRAQLHDKAARVDAIVAQREALAKQMQRVRHSMAQQEGAIRASLELLRRSGASFALPPDVARALDAPGEVQGREGEGGLCMRGIRKVMENCPRQGGCYMSGLSLMWLSVEKGVPQTR